MTRRDAAVLLFVGAAFLCLLEALSYLSPAAHYLSRSVTFPPGWLPGVFIASFVVPFGVLAAACLFLIQERYALAGLLFREDKPLPRTHDQRDRARTLGSLAFAALGLLAAFRAVTYVSALFQLVEPRSWDGTKLRALVVGAILTPALLAAYVVLAWYLFSHREDLAERLLVSEKASPGLSSNRSDLERTVFKLLGLYFVMVAVVPLCRALLQLMAEGFPAWPVRWWDFWPDAVTGVSQLVFGLGVFLGTNRLASAWRRIVRLRRM